MSEAATLPVRAQRFVTAVLRRFHQDGCLLHASGLAYTSLLSLVPLLALMFAVLKGLGVQRRLEPLLLSRLGLDPEVVERMMTYIDRTNFGTLGAVGAITLLATALAVLGSIERSFNHIWRVQQSRTWWRKATDYLSTLVLTPFLLLAAVALTSTLREQALLQWVLQSEQVAEAVPAVLRLVPFAINVVAIGILYTIMPNRRPYVTAVIIAALVAGCTWQVVQWGYVSMQIGVARYNAIYGALSQLPVTLVWIYVSWAVVLLGAEVAAVYEFGADHPEVTRISRWALAVHVLLRAVETFRGDGQPIEPGPLARELRVSREAVGQVLQELGDGGLLAAVEGRREEYVLVRDPAIIELSSLTNLVDNSVAPAGCDARVSKLFAQLAAARTSTLQQHKLADLLTDQERSDRQRR
jgi:membrane protein